MIHLDTNFLIEISVAGSVADAQFTAWICDQEVLNVSTIAWAEFLCGPVDATGEALARQIFPQPEPFLPADAVLAAVAIRCGAKLATHNTGDFEPLAPHGLMLI